MSGNGGHKHRAVRSDRKGEQKKRKEMENLRRVRNEFESKGQAWDPENNPAQMAKLNHAARRVVSRSQYSKH